MRVALVHDWLTGMRGGEYVLEAIAELFPNAELFTLISIPGSVSPTLISLKKHTSWLQRVPGAEDRYRYFLPLMPSMIERMDLNGFDLILSSSHCVAKGIRKPPGAVHVSYVHAPMRYVWDRFEDYFGPGRSSLPVRIAANTIRRRLQAWDRRVSQADRVDALIANSHFIAQQIEAAYGRPADAVVFPFADLSRFQAARKPGTSYLMVGAFAPNKRVDLAIEAFNLLKKPLYIVGKGPEDARLKKMAGPTISFLGSLSNTLIADLYAKCRAFIFPGLEDFGITPLEAMGAGAPVIAYGKGGILDTVIDGKTGLLFQDPTPESLAEKILEFEARPDAITEFACRQRASEFTRTRFQNEFLEVVKKVWQNQGKGEFTP